MDKDNEPELPLTVEPAAEPTIDVQLDAVAEPVVAKAPEPDPVKVEDPAPAPDGTLEVDLTPPEPEPEPVKGPDPVAELTAQFERMKERARAERDGRLKAEALAEQRAAEVVREARGRADAQMHAIVNAIAAEKGEAEGLKAALREAHKQGDPERVADITMRLGEIGSRLASLNDGKAQLEAYLKNPRAAPKPSPDNRREPAPTPYDDLDDAPPADPIEAYIGKQTPRVQQYLRTRDAKGWLGDARKSSRLAAAHHEALAEGYVEESPGYFAYIDDKMGVAKVSEKPNGKAAPRVAKAAIPAAPISQKASAAPTTAVNNARVVTLSAAQQDAARSLGLSNAEYAKRVWAMKQPGYGGPKFGGN